MVSNTLSMDLDDLVATLKRVGETCGDDVTYVEMRAKLPAAWPI